MVRFSLTMACVASCMMGARAFILSAAQPVTPSSLRPRHTSPATPGAARQSDVSTSRVSMLLGGLLVGAACRQSRRKVARSVTLEDIEKLTVDRVPPRWVPISGAKARRNFQIQGIARQLDKTFFFMAVNRDRMLGSEVEEARAMFPPTVNVRCIRNSHIRKAMEGTDWEPMIPKIVGSNMYVFVESDKDLKPAIQAYVKMEKKFDRNAKIDAIKEDIGDTLTFDLQPMTGGLMRDEWKVLEPADVLKLKDFPTKTELIGQIAGSIKQVTTKLAVGVKQVPTKLAVGLKKTVEKGEEGGKSSVGEVTPE